MENFKIKNKIFFEAGGKREAGGDDKLTIFFMGPYIVMPKADLCVLTTWWGFPTSPGISFLFIATS
jgi:hypothetical protein